MLIVLGAVIGMVGLVVLTGGLTATERQRDVATEQRDDLARDLQTDATTVAALCATGGDVARALEASGQCDRSRARLVNPIVNSVAPALTPGQIDEIVRRVLAQTPAPADTEQIIAAALERVRADPALRGLGEAEVRAIVAAAMASVPPPADGRDGVDGLPGRSFVGLDFVRRDGVCVAVITALEPDGTTDEDVVPVGDAVCGPVTPDPTTPPPDPDPTTDPAPAPTAPAPTTAAPPATTATPAPPTDDGGLLGP